VNKSGLTTKDISHATYYVISMSSPSQLARTLKHIYGFFKTEDYTQNGCNLYDCYILQKYKSPPSQKSVEIILHYESFCTLAGRPFAHLRMLFRLPRLVSVK
jgi:hypothetical protein